MVSVPDETWCQKVAIRSTESHIAYSFFFLAGIRVCAKPCFVCFVDNLFVYFIQLDHMYPLIHWPIHFMHA